MQTRLINPLTIVTALGLALAGCVAAPTESNTVETGTLPDPDMPPPMSAQQREECTAQGGTPQRRGMLNLEMCVVPYSDAGKSCTDSSQCEGLCQYHDLNNVGQEEDVVGQCQPDTAPYGCFAEVRGGKAFAAMCID